MAKEYIHQYHSRFKRVHLASIFHSIQIVSSGFLTGRYGAVEIDGSNVLGSTFNRELLLSSSTQWISCTPERNIWYVRRVIGQDTSYSTSLALFLNNLPQRSLAVMLSLMKLRIIDCVCRSAIMQFGSRYINNVRFRDSGRYSVKKVLLRKCSGKMGTSADSQRVTLDTTISRSSLTGEILSEAFGPASQWTKASIISTVPQEGGWVYLC